MISVCCLSVKNPRTPRKYQNAQKLCSVTIRTYRHIGRYTATSETLTEQRLQHALDKLSNMCEYISMVNDNNNVEKDLTYSLNVL